MSYQPSSGSAIDRASLLDSSHTDEFSYSRNHETVSPATPLNSDGFKAGTEESQEFEHEAAEAENDTSEPARRSRSLMTYRAALGELCATFVLVFTACGVGIATNERINASIDSANNPDVIPVNLPAAVIGSIGVSTSLIGSVFGGLTVAFVAMALIFAFAPISGAHMNPAVTVAVWASRRTSTRKAIFYIVAQLIGANLAQFALLLAFNFDTGIFKYAAVTPGPKSNVFSVFFMEFALTFILVFIIFKVAFESVEEEKKKTMSFKTVGGARGLTIYAPSSQSRLGFAPLAIGTCIGVLGGVGSSVSGGAYNPARYLAPAIWSLSLSWWSIAYVLGQLSGGCSAALIRYAFDYLGRLAQIQEDKAAKLRKANRGHVQI